MKRTAVLVSALLFLLTACGKGPEAPTAVPAPTPTSAPAATPSPIPEADWREDVALSDLPLPADGTVTLEGGTALACLGEAEGADLALYRAVPAQGSPALLLRYVDKLQWFDAVDPAATVSTLVWDDFDGDGADELCAILRFDHTSSLTMYEWDDGFTAVPYAPEDFSAELLELLDYRSASRTATVTHGRESASLTLGPGESGPIGFHEDFGDLSYFNLDGTDLSAVFGVGADVNGEVRYFATLLSSVAYDGAGFTLADLRLVSNSGV